MFNRKTVLWLLPIVAVYVLATREMPSNLGSAYHWIALLLIGGFLWWLLPTGSVDRKGTGGGDSPPGDKRPDK